MSKGSVAAGVARQVIERAILFGAVCAAALVVTSCVEYPRPYGAGYYSAGYGYPYGYGYPDYGYPYYGAPYGYAGPSIMISGARYHGYRSPYYRDRYYSGSRAAGGTSRTRTGNVAAPPRVSGPKARPTGPRTQATVPQ